MTTATPRPWLLDLLEGGGWAVVVDPTPAGAKVVAELDDTTGDRAANAALIVRAVNAHDDLVAALRAAEWYTKYDNTEAFCTVCGGDRPAHYPKCIVGRTLATLDAASQQEEVVIPDFGDAPVRQRGETEGYGNKTDHFAFTGDEYKRQP